MPDLTTSDGVVLHVEVAGPDDAPTVLLVHGFTGSVDVSWRSTGVVDALVAGGRRVVAFDLRGHGRSGAAVGAGVVSGDARLVEDVTEVAARFGPADVVAGYSMGAALVLLALERGLAVRAAVVGAAPPAVLRWTEADDAAVFAAVEALVGGGDDGDELGLPGDPAMLAWTSFLDSVGADRASLAAVLAGHRPVVSSWDAIDVPVVVAAGDADVLAAPPDEVAARLPSARVVRLRGDHLAAAADPALVAAILDS